VPVYQKTELPSGLRIVTERVPGARSAALGIWITVGSRHETASENGISHFIEHMAFKGTATRSALDIAKSIEQGGGYVNAFTSKELTCFHVHVLDERLDDATDILTDILRHSKWDAAEIEKEKLVVLDEIRDHEDMPDDVAHEYFIQSLFAPHALARPILGAPENVKAFTRKDVLKFVKHAYVPSRMVVAAAGHVNHSRLVGRIAEALDHSGVSGTIRNARIPKMTPGFDRHARPIQQAHMIMGTRGLPYGHLERFTMSVMNSLLGGGMSSRLFQNIREKHGVAYSIYCFAEMMGDTGAWGVYLATDQDRVDRARQLVLDELRILREVPVPKDELDGIKGGLKGNIMLGLESISSRMMRLGRMAIYLNRYHTLEDVSRQIDSVTPKRVQELANQILQEDQMVTTIVEPAAAPKRKVPVKKPRRS
jgi:predicted Zn-dependent peptidase